MWAKSENNPAWTREIFGDEFKDVVYKHLDDTMDHFNNLDVVHWDVINEMIDHTFYIEQSGDENIRTEIHQYLKQKYPQNLFYINDYGIIMNSQNRFSLFQQLLRDLFASGVVVDGIGLQSHINTGVNINWNFVKERVDQLWEEFQIPIWITEFDWNHNEDVDMGDHSEHAQIVTDFYKLMFSNQVSKSL